MDGNQMDGEGFTTVKNTTTADSERLLTLFPKELWSRIFNYLDDIEDLKRVSNASPGFRNMLVLPLAVDAFPRVWSIIEERCSKSEMDLMPSFMRTIATDGRLWFLDVLPLRLVNKAWKTVLDDFYSRQDLPIAVSERRSLFPNERSMHSIFARSEGFCWEGYRIIKCLNYFEGTHGNGLSDSSPFVRRRLCFNIPSHYYRSCFLNFTRAMTCLLREYGRHILILELEFVNTTWSPQIFFFFHQWISLVPNLTCLTLRCVGCWGGDIGPIHYMPPLNRLEYLNLQSVMTDVANVLMQTYNHVTVLHLEAKEVAPLYDLSTISYPNLNDLRIIFGSWKNFRKLETARINSSLQTLEVTVMWLIPLFPEIFEILAKKWGHSLKKLTVNAPRLTAIESDREKYEMEIAVLKEAYFPGLDEFLK